MVSFGCKTERQPVITCVLRARGNGGSISGWYQGDGRRDDPGC